MQSGFRKLVSTLILALPLSGCGSDESSDTGDTGPIEQPCANYASARCGAMERCAPALFDLEHGNAEACRAQLAAWCIHVGNLPGVQAGPKAIGTCASTFDSMSCDTWQSRRDDPLCAAPGGTLGDGAPCLDGYQCSSRACHLDASGTCGACQPAAKTGHPCRLSMECPTSTACVGYKCVEVAGIGESCDSARPCGGVLMCVGGTCTKSPTPGEACVDGVCNNKLATSCDDGSCQALPTASTGEPCGLVGGQTVYCGGGTCSSQNTCVAPVPDGRPCNDTSGPTCLLPAICVDGWCKTPDPASCP